MKLYNNPDLLIDDDNKVEGIVGWKSHSNDY